MKCPVCGSVHVKVKETRPDAFNTRVRRRTCKSCEHIWLTLEVEVPVAYGYFKSSQQGLEKTFIHRVAKAAMP